MADHFDLCIIGTGSGNSILDDRFAQWKVAMVERDVFGGTCLNRGCIPSKMLVYPADVVETIRHAGPLGIDAEVHGIRWEDVRDRAFDRIDAIAESGRDYRLGQDHVTVFEADGRFVGHKRLRVGDDEITADRFVLAAGARSAIPAIPGLDQVDHHTSDNIMRIERVPRRLLVIGSGFIACELAHVFEAFGAEVAMVLRHDTLLRQADHEVSHRLTERFGERMRLLRHASVTQVHQRSDGEIEAHLDGPGGPTVERADMLLVATGRIPNGGQLDVEATGVRLDADGYVMTDESMRTDVEGIWALGDIRNRRQLKHLANLEARIVQHNVLHPDDPRRLDERVVPYGVFTTPQVGSVGLTESEVRRHGRPAVSVVREYASVAYGWALGDSSSAVKLIADVATRRLLGAHVIGPQASLLIQQLVQGMRFGQSVDEMARDVIYPHPALSEVVENALLDLITELDRTAS